MNEELYNAAVQQAIKKEVAAKIRKALEDERCYDESPLTEVEFYALAEQVAMELRHEAERLR